MCYNKCNAYFYSMKKSILLIGLFTLCCNVSFSQESNSKSDEEIAQALLGTMFTSKVSMDVEEGYFSDYQAGTYLDSANGAVLMSMVVPATYEKMKADLSKEGGKMDNYSDKGEFTENGKNVLYIKGIEEQGGIKVNVAMYVFEADENSCLMITGTWKDGADPKYSEVIKKAALSAQVVK